VKLMYFLKSASNYLTAIFWKYILLSMVLWPSFLNAQKYDPQVIWVDEQFKYIDITGSMLQVAEDVTKAMPYTSVKSLSFEPFKGSSPNFGFKNSSFWFKIKLMNTQAIDRQQIIEVRNPNLDKVELVAEDDKGELSHYLSGDAFPWKQRMIRNKYFRFYVNIPARSALILYLNAQNSGEQFHVPLSIGDAMHYSEYDSSEQAILGIYFGILVFALLLNLFFFFVLRDTSTLYYIGYLAGLLLLQLSLTGLGFQYFWPESPYMADHANPIFANISILFLMHFSVSFLKTAAYLPRLHRFYMFLARFLILSSLLAFIPVHACYLVSVLSINIVAMILNVMIIPTAIYIWRQKYKPARFFTIAFILLIIGVFVFVLRNFGLIRPGFFADYGLQLGSGCEVLLLTLAVIDKFKQFKDEAFDRLNALTVMETEANVKLEQKVHERTQQIQFQKIEIEEKNKEIVSSIRYAKRIQEAILPSDEQMQALFPEHFVFYRPRDIVSGDFYWASPVQTTVGSDKDNLDLQLLALADCTGHGVPGAFMSLIGNNYLKQSVSEPQINSPAQALDFLNARLLGMFHQKSTDKVRDGMDIVMIALNLQQMEMRYAGANGRLYLVRDQELQELQTDKYAIGSVEVELKPYTDYQVNLQKGDMIYMLTDGFADQFGGEKGKKFSYKRTRELLLNLASSSVEIQRQQLESSFVSWKGDIEQIDDVCVVGVRIV
jgi:two-component system, sensor histidine kinase LadS